MDSVTDILARAAVGKVSSDMPVNRAFGSRRSRLDVISEAEAILGRPLPVEHVLFFLNTSIVGNTPNTWIYGVTNISNNFDAFVFFETTCAL